MACERIHGNRSQAQRTEALAGFKSGKYRVLVATDIAARGIDVEELSHVVNFDVPHVPDDYIHRVGRTARAEATGDAFTFVAPDEEGDLFAIERAVGKRLPRVTLPGFDYTKRPQERLEIPIAERIAQIRAQKAGERARAKEKVERRNQTEAEMNARIDDKVRRQAGAPARRPSAPAAPRHASGRLSRRRSPAPPGRPSAPPERLTTNEGRQRRPSSFPHAPLPANPSPVRCVSSR